MADFWANDPVAPAPATAQPADPSQFWANDAPVASSPAAPPLDKYQQAAADKIAKLKAAGEDPSYGAANSAENGVLLGALPTVMAGLTTLPSMIEHATWDPREGYNYAKAQQNALLASGNAEQPWTNGLATLAGGIGTGTLASAGGLTMVPAAVAGTPAPGLLATAAGMAGDGAAYGAATGFNSGEGSDRLTGALTGAAAGGALGAAIPVAGNMLTGNPVVSNLRALINPSGFANSQLARAILESGQAPQDLQTALDTATAAGQPNFALADALGNSGQRMLTTVTKSPGPGREAAHDFLETRQAGQSGDVSSALADALAAPNTAAQTTAGLTAQRTADAATNYGAARTAGGAVDVTPAITLADQTLTPGVTKLVNPNSNIADNSIESAVSRAKSFLTDGTSQLSDFQQVFQAKQEIDNMIDGATPTVQRVLIPIRNSLDDQLASASQPYANARDTFRQQSQGIEAIPAGTSAARPGVRAADAIDQFNATAPTAQQPFRAGFADPLIAKSDATPYTANAARPLLNPATQAKLDAVATSPQAAQNLRDSLGRSNTMFQTRAKALGGSPTVENINDQSASGVDPMQIWDAVSEGIPGLIRGAARVGGNLLGGSTPRVRSALGEALLMHGQGADVMSRLAPAVQSQIRSARLAKMIAGGAFGGAASSTANAIDTSPSGPR